jgi:hypothetical protein
VELECEFRICSSLHTARDALVGRVRSTRSPKAMRGVWGQVGKQSPGRRARSRQACSRRGCTAPTDQDPASRRGRLFK